MEDVADNSLDAHFMCLARLRADCDFKYLGALCVCQVRDCIHLGSHRRSDFSHSVHWILHLWFSSVVGLPDWSPASLNLVQQKLAASLYTSWRTEFVNPVFMESNLA